MLTVCFFVPMQVAATSTLEQDKRALTMARIDAAEARDKAKRTREDVTRASAEFDFFQGIRRWVSDLCGFLTAKQRRLKRYVWPCGLVAVALLSGLSV